MTDSDDKSSCCFKISAFGENGYVEVLGPGNMNVAPVLKDICYAMINESKNTIFVNLVNCVIVDSTFMGTLVNIQERFAAAGIEEGKLLVLNQNDDIKRLFAMVGIDQMLETVPDEIEVPDFTLKVIDDLDVDRAEKLRVVVEAHEKLVELNEMNKEKFEKFVNIVKSEMREDGIGLRKTEDDEDDEDEEDAERSR